MLPGSEWKSSIHDRESERGADQSSTDMAVPVVVVPHLLMLVGSRPRSDALQGSRDIGMAIGITMNASNLTSDQAFEVLSRASQDTNRKLRDIATELVRTGVLPHVASAPGLAVHAAGSDYR